jgi:hypothetical protein
MRTNKPIHVKPSLYAFYFEILKVVAMQYGYNLVLHGSMNRDLDLIAIPWQKEIGNPDEMVDEFATVLGGFAIEMSHAQKNCFPHGRRSYIININRSGKHNDYEDAMYYLDISVTPTGTTKTLK